MSNDIQEALLKAPDSQLDPSVKPMIQKWKNPPTAIQILEVLDFCIHGSEASGFVVGLLQMMYNQACKAENTTHEQVVLGAHWRNRS